MTSERNTDNVSSYNLPFEELQKEFSRLEEEKIIERIRNNDYSVWKDGPEEIGNRLGWLTIHRSMEKCLPEIDNFIEGIRSAGFTKALLLGMGGSSLAPEVFSQIFGVRKGYLELAVLDSTNPETIATTEKQLNYDKTLFIVSTKSGGTIETLSMMKYFYNKAQRNLGSEKAGKHFIAITDPGSSLEAVARKLDFNKIISGDPNTGGRYSALSVFGLLPAALAGVDIKKLLDRASKMEDRIKPSFLEPENRSHPAWLGITLGALGKSGRDKITFIMSPQLQPFGAWIEQLLAESTGKEGKGLLPVEGEDVASPQAYASDRFFIYIHLFGDSSQDHKIKALLDNGQPLVKVNLQDFYDLGGEMYRWMMATAVTGWVLKINPFDQPNVEAAKKLAREMVNIYQVKGSLPAEKPDLRFDNIEVYSGLKAVDLKQVWYAFLDFAQKGDKEGRERSYIAIQAYLEPSPETDRALQALRKKIQEHLRMAVTVGYGPRFLHSTGQLHKGDAGKGLFIQLTAKPTIDLPIPDEPGDDRSSVNFSILLKAQALGDRKALIDAGRKVISFNLSGDLPSALERLTASI